MKNNSSDKNIIKVLSSKGLIELNKQKIDYNFKIFSLLAIACASVTFLLNFKINLIFSIVWLIVFSFAIITILWNLFVANKEIIKNIYKLEEK